MRTTLLALATALWCSASAADYYWTGNAGTTDWSGANWTNKSETDPETEFRNGESAHFDASATNRAVTVDADVQVADMTVTGGVTYNFTGTGGISSGTNGKLYVTESSTAVFANFGTNNFVGGTQIESGSTVQLAGTDGKLGGEIVNAGTFEINRSGDYTLDNTISGAGTTKMSGAGTLTIGGDGDSQSNAFHQTDGIVNLTKRWNGNYTQASGILTGDGTIEKILVSAKDLRPGNETTLGTLNVTGDANFSGATLRFKVDGTNSDKIEVGGTVKISEGGKITTIDILNFTTGTYTLLTGGNDFFEDVTVFDASLLVGGSAKAARQTVTFDNSNQSEVVVRLSAGTKETLTWAGADGDLWRGTNKWTATNPNDETFIDGDEVVFNDLGSQTIGLGTSDVTVASMTVNGGDYTFTGNGVGIRTGDATGKLVKKGSGTLTLNGISDFKGGILLDNGTINIEFGGALTTYGVSINAADSPIPILRVSSTLNNSGILDIGNTTTGSLIVANGGVVNQAIETYIGRTGTGIGDLLVESGGTFYQTGADKYFRVGGGANGESNTKGTLTIEDGGTVDITSNIHIGAYGVGNANIDGHLGSSANSYIGCYAGGKGVATIGQTGTFSGNGSLTIGYNSSSSGTLIVEGHAEIGTNLYIGYNGTGALNLTGGGKATSAGNIYIGANAGSAGTITVGSGCTLESTGGNIYVGGNASGAAGTGLLAGSGAIEGQTTVYATGSLSPGDTPGAIGTLTFSDDLTLDGATLTIDLGAGNTSDKLAIGGKLTLGTQEKNTLNLASFVEGEYTIATFNSCDLDPTSNDNFKVLINGDALSKRQTVSFAQSTENSIIIKVSSDDNIPLTWTGNTSGNWHNTETGDENWTDAADSGETRFRNGDAALFDASGSNKNITIQDGGLSVAAMTVSGNADYTFSNGNLTGTATGTTILDATGALTKSGNGTLTLNNAASFTSTTVSGGTLQIGNGSTTGAFTGDIENNAALVFNRSDAYAYSDDISGTGSLTKTGGGALTLSGENTYTGATNINDGTLNLQTGLAESDVTVNNAALNTGAVTVKSLTANSGSNITPTGTLNVTGEANFDNAEVDFGLLTGGNKIIVGGKASINSVTARVDATGIINSNSYTLLEFGTIATSGIHVISVSGLGENRGGDYIDNNALKFDVIVGNTRLTWNGSSNTWNDNDWTNRNWSTGNINTYFKTGDNVIFDGSARNKNVIVEPGGVSVGTMEVKDDYNFSGGKITAGDVTIAAGKSLGLKISDNATPMINAASVNFNNSRLNITGYAPGSTTSFTAPLQAATVITTSGGVENFNPAVMVLNQASVDFLSASARLSEFDVLVETGLTWYSTDPNRPAHGDFTIADGETFTLGADLIDQTGNGGWDGKSLTKKGDGTLILTGDNAYTGATNINGGTLNLQTGLAESDVTVNNAALNAGAVTVKSLTANSGSNITPTGTLNVTGKAIFNGATVDLSSGLGTNKIAVTGIVKFETNNTTFTLGDLSAVEFDRNYHLMTGAQISGLDMLTASVTLGDLRGGFYLADGDTKLFYGIINGNTSLYWSDHLGYDWNTTSTNTNWTTGNFATYFKDGDNVIFDTYATSKSVSVDAGGVDVANMTISGSDYEFSGGQIIGTGLLAINESASFKNQFTGFTGVSIADGKKLTIDTSTDSWDLAANLSGNGSFKKTGTGTLTLSGSNTLNGTTTIESGILKLAGNASYSSAETSASFTLNSGTALDWDANSSIRIGGDFTLVSDAMLIIDIAVGNVSSTITVSGAVTFGSAHTIDLNDETLGSYVLMTSANGFNGFDAEHFTTTLNGAAFSADRKVDIKIEDNQLILSITKDVSLLTVAAIADETYTGSAIEPLPVVMDGTTILVKDVDYIVSYNENKNVGTATITIAGKGNYSEERDLKFNITVKDIADATVTVATIDDETYTGSAIEPLPVVVDGTTILVKDVDYIVSYNENKNVGTATITITGKGNYSEEREIDFNIAAKDIADASITTSAIESQYYEGVAIEPQPTVEDGSTTLVEGTDYRLSYSNNNTPGKGTITITGEGNYTGTRTIDFTIVDRRALGNKLEEIMDDILNNEEEKEKYTDESLKALEETIDDAIAVLNDPDATQAEIDAALQQIEDALNNLVECIPFNQLISTHWNNTLTVNNNPEKNGGLVFLENQYQWYVRHDDETEFTAIDGATGQYYSAGISLSDVLSATDYYRVTMYTEAGQMATCGGHPILDNTLRSAKAALRAYPNPVQSGASITIEGVEAGSTVTVFNQNGVCVLQTVVEMWQSLQMNVPAGNYVVKTNNGELKVVVTP